MSRLNDENSVIGEIPYLTASERKQKMKCTVDESHKCDNEDLSKCETCIAPSWCFCKRDGANKGQSIIRKNREKAIFLKNSFQKCFNIFIFWI